MQDFLLIRDKVNNAIIELAKNAKKGESGILLYLNIIADNIPLVKSICSRINPGKIKLSVI